MPATYTSASVKATWAITGAYVTIYVPTGFILAPTPFVVSYPTPFSRLLAGVSKVPIVKGFQGRLQTVWAATGNQRPASPYFTSLGSPVALLGAPLGVAYSNLIEVSGGASPFTFAVTSGTLPTGLSLNASTGLISGTATAAAPYSFTVTVTDTLSNTASQAFTLLASSGSVSNTNPTPVAQVLLSGTVGTAYAETIAAQGGSAPYTFSLTSGSLPTGLSLNSGTGVISGTPGAVGTFNFTLTVIDANGYAGSQAFTISVVAAPAAGGGRNSSFVS